MNRICRTIYNSYLSTCQLTGIPFQMSLNSTLNELFNIQQLVAPNTTPTLAYYAIGNGGHKMTVGADGVPLTEPIQHKGTDAGLFNQIPFVLRPINNDIDAGMRANYALRRIETHNNTDYIAYYLKRLPLAGVAAGMEYITLANGIQTVSAFTPTSADLNPTPPIISNTGVNVISGDYISASAKINITLTNLEVTEIMNACTVLYGNANYAIISELALCSGVDKAATSPSAGNTMINVNEAISVQVLSFINTFFSLAFSNNGISLALDIGNSEPVLSIG